MTSRSYTLSTRQDECNLPAELWPKVFAYLPADDRTNFRLTCRWFYDSSNTSGVHKTEQIVLHGENDTGAALRYLSNSNRRAWNLRFDEVHLDNSVLPFFGKHGAHVRSLLLHGCEVEAQLLKQIISDCTNLQRFAFTLVQPNSTRSASVTPILLLGSVSQWPKLRSALDAFLMLHNERIIREKVTDFTLRFDYSDGGTLALTNAEFLRFFVVFPNIKNLDLSCPMDENHSANYVFDPETNGSVARSETELSIHSIYHQLVELRHQLVYLRLDFRGKFANNIHCSNQVLVAISQIQMNNLKQLSLRGIHHLSQVSLIESYPHFNYLTDFKCTIDMNLWERVPQSALIDLLSSALELESLQINESVNFLITNDCFQALVRSRLRTLNIPKCAYCASEYSRLDDSLPPNRSLRQLKSLAMDHFTLLLFTKYFRRLESISVQQIEEQILRNIFEYQTELRYLILNISSYPDTSPLRRWYENGHNCRLNYLTHLYIGENVSESEFFLSKYTFPKLKSLTIKIPNAISERWTLLFDTFYPAILNLTELEYLEMRCNIGAPSQQWLDYCRALPKLRYLLVYDDKYVRSFSESEYHRFFQVRPSLRTIIHRPGIFQHSRNYSRNIRTNTVTNDSIQIPEKYIYYKDSVRGCNRNTDD